MFNDHERPLRCALGMTKTLFAQVATAARSERRLEMRNSVAAPQHVLPTSVELVPRWTHTCRAFSVVLKILEGE